MTTTGIIYLIHLEEGMVVRTTPTGTIVYATHYIGWTSNPDKRLAAHASGNGSSFMAAVKRREIKWRVVRMWEGTRNDERKIKKRHEAPRFCPACIDGGHSPRGLLSPKGIKEIPVPEEPTDPHFNVIDSKGKVIRVGSRVKCAGWETTSDPILKVAGEVTAVSDPDGDLDDEGRPVALNPVIAVEFEDAMVDTFITSSTATGPLDDDSEYRCDDLEVA